MRGYPRAFWVLFAGTFINRLGLLVLPFLTLYLTAERGVSVAAATFVVALYGAGAFAAGPLGGALADRFGRRSVLVLSLTGGALLLLAIPHVSGYGPLAVLVLAFGAVGEMYRPAVSAAVADLVPAGHVARAFALIYWAINLGVAFGPALGGLLAERVGYGVLFTVDAASMALYAAAVLVGVPETRPAPPPEASPEAPARATAPAAPEALPIPPKASALRRALADPGLVGLALATFGAGVAFTQAFSTLPLAMAADGLGPDAFGLAVMVNGGVVVALSLPVARWAEERLGPPLLAGAVALIGIGVGLHLFADTLLGHAAAVAVWSLGEIAFIPIVPAILARLAPADLRGTYQGVNQGGWGLAKVAGPAVGGLVLARLGEAALWGGAVVVGLAVAALMLRLRLGEPRPLAEVPAAPEASVRVHTGTQTRDEIAPEA